MRFRSAIRTPALGLITALAIVAAACATDPEPTAQPTTTASTTTSTSTTTTTLPTYEYPASFTEEGYPLLGDPDAPVTLVEFSDYLCPFCGRHFSLTKPQLLEQYVESGEVNFVFRDLPIESLHPNAPSGHAAALCVAEQDAGLFWAYHDRLFETQSAWESLPDASAYLEDLAGEVGADVDAYAACIAAGETATLVDESVAKARDLGFSATPSFQVVDNRTGDIYEIVGAQPFEVFTQTLDAVVAGGAPPTTAPPEVQLPYWASDEGLEPDPDRPGYTLGGDAYKGNPEAELVVIEASDFQCPFCRRHATETEPSLDEAYVDTGQILWVFKHLPLPSHPQAQIAASAAECAGDQGAFWEMHDALFASVEDWSVDEPDDVFGSLAAGIGIDSGEFAACLDGRAALERVLSDLNDLSGVIGSTPTFILLKDGQATGIEGAQPLETFVTVFDQVLGQD